MLKPRLIALLSIVLAAAALRLLPHPPNLTPIAAVALFGGAYFQDRRLAFAAPLGPLLLSDLVLGFYPGMPVVYLSFTLVVPLGLWLRPRRRPVPIAGAALCGSLLFFVLTNFGVWAASGLYPMTLSGLTECYVAALPFCRNEILGDLCYALLLFGGFALLERLFAALREPIPAHGLAAA
jgi:hypothetical protein